MREVGVSVYSEAPDLQVSYMAADGGWHLLGTISADQRQRWSEGSKEAWWTAEVAADQRELSLRLVASGAPPRTLLVPIVDGQVRFDLEAERAAPEEAPGGEVEAESGVPTESQGQVAPAAKTKGVSGDLETSAGKARRDPQEPSEISPGYKDNPY
jgi:hypothetical protein